MIGGIAGAAWRDRMLAVLGALFGILLIELAGWLAVPLLDSGLGLKLPLPAILAPLGASAVLVFAVPSSPMAQPRSVIGGSVLSALVGMMVVHVVPYPELAGALAVALAILAMSLARCLHPPGGAMALLGVIGGPAVTAAGFAFPFTIVLINVATLVLAGWLFHRLSGHSYPHRAVPMPGVPVMADPLLHRDDIDLALKDMGEAYDIAMEDLEMLLQRAEFHAGQRQGHGQRAGGKAA